MLAADLKKALLHSLLGKYVLYIIQLVSMMVLARLIAPEIFGVVAAVSVIAMFFQMIGVSGLTPAIVYQEKVDATLRNSIFTFTLLIGLVLAALFTVSAPYLSNRTKGSMILPFDFDIFLPFSSLISG